MVPMKLLHLELLQLLYWQRHEQVFPTSYDIPENHVHGLRVALPLATHRKEPCVQDKYVACQK